MADKVYVGDNGTVIIVDCGEDISGATGISLKVKKPNNALVSWSGSLYGTNGIQYAASAGDFDIPGKYYIQPYMTIGTWTGRGKTVHLEVYEHFR